MLLSSIATKPRFVAMPGECLAASRTRQSNVIHSRRLKKSNWGWVSPSHSMRHTEVVTPAQMRTGTSDDAFHFTAGHKQKTQSNSRSLWVDEKCRNYFLIVVPDPSGNGNSSTVGAFAFTGSVGEMKS